VGKKEKLKKRRAILRERGETGEVGNCCQTGKNYEQTPGGRATQGNHSAEGSGTHDRMK